MRNALEHARTVVAVHAHESACRDIELPLTTKDFCPLQREFTHDRLCIGYKDSRDRACEDLEVVAAVAAEDGVPVAEVMQSHQRLDGMLLAGTRRQDIEQPDTDGFIDAPDQACPDAVFLKALVDDGREAFAIALQGHVIAELVPVLFRPLLDSQVLDTM